MYYFMLNQHLADKILASRRKLERERGGKERQFTMGKIMKTFQLISRPANAMIFSGFLSAQKP